MKKKVRIRYAVLGILIGGFFILFLDHLVGFSADTGTRTKEKERCEQLLLKIYKEVVELGYRDNEDFIKREFHFDLDGSRDNREEHILVLSHKEGAGEKMILQLTFFNKIKSSYVRHAKEIREITCLVNGECIEIKEFGFSKSEEKLLPKILKGIRHEKKYYKLIPEK